MINAKEASDTAAKVRLENAQKQISYFENSIGNAVNEGKNSVNVFECALPDTMAHFKKLGYSIRNESGRGDDVCIITW